MLTLGRNAAGDEPADLLAACHERIRRFLGVAARLASSEPATDDDVRDAAASVRRYFAEALPLHERDEDDTVAPRLAGRSAALDQALAAMHAQHDEMRPWIARLIATTAALADAPDRRAAVRRELAEAHGQLDARFYGHLMAEERLVFPALAELPPDERAAIRAEMRARRTPPA